MFVISPKLTSLMVMVIFSIVGVGSLVGSGLRSLSKQAQEQVDFKGFAIVKCLLGRKGNSCNFYVCGIVFG